MKNLITRFIAAHHIRQAKRWKDKRQAEGRKYMKRRLGKNGI